VNFVIRQAAREDILSQYRYYLIEKNAEPAAERFIVAVQAAIEQICKRPELAPLKPLKSPSLSGLRSKPVKGFPSIRIYYLVSEGTVRIIRILHGKRDLNPLLEN
jgi:toxin ParE1/3/4